MSMESVVDEVDIVLKKHGLGIDEYRSDDKGNMYITVIPLIFGKPKKKKCFYRTFCVTWVQDVPVFDAEKIILKFNYELINRPKGSRYVKGEPKNGSDDYVGIYFEDPMVLW